MQKGKSKKSIASLYIEKYDIKDDENEEKRVRRFVRKLHQDKSVFSNYPFDYMIEEEQLLFLNYLMTVLPERQIMANMEKIDVDRDYSNFVLQNIETGKITNLILKNDLSRYKPICLDDEYYKSRFVIRDLEKNSNQVLQNLLQTNEKIYDDYRVENVFFISQGFEICNFSYVKEYVDYVINVIMQLMIYRVFNNTKIQEWVSVLTSQIEILNKLLDDKLEGKKTEWQNNKDANVNCLNAEMSSKCFSIYVAHRSKLYEEINIKRILKEEMMNAPLKFGDVPTHYFAKKVLMQDDECLKENKIITEGERIDQYKKKIGTVQKFIGIMSIYGGRQCYPNCLQDIKVYFREIYISKASYGKRKAPVIVKAYIEQFEKAIMEGKEIPQFDKQSQYMFVREKINRGYFREKGLSKEYIAKIDFETGLYNLLLKCYLFYDVQESLNFIYEINKRFLECYQELLTNETI